MVSFSIVQSSNSRISSTLPPGLVAVFIGATSGIGEITLKTYAKYARKPRAYFVGRSQDAGDRIAAECKRINPTGEYAFIKADVSLIRNVDEVCEVIKKKETVLNILFLSAGVRSMDRSETTEHIHLLTALLHYSRLRFIINLLPLVQAASSLRRVISVGGSGREGPIDATDFPALNVPLFKIRGHLTSLMTLGLEGVAKGAMEVSFVHNYPGTVDTKLFRRVDDMMGVALRVYMFLLGRWVCVPVEECGERQLYLATSAQFPPAEGGREGEFAVPLGEGVEIARGTTGKVGSGVYSVAWDGESASPAVEKLLAGLRDEGMVDAIWRHTQREYERISELHTTL